MKKLGILFAVLIMSLMFAVSASALEPTGQCGDNVYWEYDETTGELVISGEGEMWNYSGTNSPFFNSEIKSVFIKYGVTTIGNRSFYGSGFTTISIPNSVTSINKEAFLWCFNLKYINIPNSITKIGKAAFYMCSQLKDVTIGDGVISIDSWAFANTNIAQITIPNSLKKIGDYAFYMCKITELNIPANATEIGIEAFGGCSQLTYINVHKDNKSYSNDSYGTLFDKNKTKLILYPIGNKQISYIIPNSISKIEASAFRWAKNLLSIVIPNGVTNIGDSAFLGCQKLTEIIIPESVITIGERAFMGCSGISYMNIPSNVEHIGENAFEQCINLISITVEIINKYYSSYEGVLFDKNKTTLIQYPAANKRNHYSIPIGVVKIEAMAFYYSINLMSLVIPYSMSYIGDMAFFACQTLKNIYFLGPEIDWNSILIGAENENLINAKIHLNHKHSYYLGKGFDSTCTEKGEKWYVCECGDSYKVDIPATGHKEQIVKGYPATCDKYGLSDGAYCSVCYVIIKNPVEIDPLGHNFSTDFTIDLDPTCTSEGQKSRHCLNCTEKTDVTVIGKLAHIYSEAITAPTCTAQGYTTYTCGCGDTYKGDYIDKLEHSYNVTTIAPKCTDKGYNVYTCSCGDNYTETIEATGHSFSGSACVNCGYDKADSCSCNCHKSGIANLIFKIILFFQKLFRTNGECACGARHY